MRNEMTIVDKLIKKSAPSLNEGLQFTLVEGELVGKLFKVAVDIPVNEKEEIGSDKFLFVKEAKEGNLEVEVRNSDDKIIGLLKASETAFEKLINDEAIEEVVTESVPTVNESKKYFTEAVDPKLINAVAEAVADEDFEAASDALSKIDSDEDIYEALVTAVAKVGDMDEDDAEDLVDEFLEEIDTDDEEDDELDERMKLVVRGGKVKRINVPIRKKRLNAKQKAALRKARRKAHTSSANKARRKSMIVRRRRFKESMDMLGEVKDTIESYGLAVLDTDLDMTNESVALELTLDNTDSFEVNLTEMESYFSEQFNADVEIPDVQLVNENQAAVLKLIVR
ncbi:hypothetical protein SP15_037 [Bacillus phage SP-15]|uniref:Uncharacterized protein n=1 Tax=Bacillus phage SP-15 TaxID=1792032 RepID=A0A127AVY7_9CAUD|nr:hypothetical protein SP15_037 [Bacillus phage SP-15]AMM44836.1 hypothetical protein SP15_037 [Bacillus phage SP-15]